MCQAVGFSGGSVAGQRRDCALSDEVGVPRRRARNLDGIRSILCLSSSGALPGRDETAWDLDQSVSLLRELLGQLRPRGILTPWMAELERLLSPALIGHGRGRNKRGRDQVSNYETVEAE